MDAARHTNPTQFSLIRNPKGYEAATHTGIDPKDFIQINAYAGVGSRKVGEMHLARAYGNTHYVDMIYVDPSHRNTGVGSALWNFAENTLPKATFVHIPEDMSPEGMGLAKSRERLNPSRHIFDED